MPAARLKQHLKDFQQFVVDVVYDRRDDPRANAFGSVLRVLSLGYGAAIELRHWLYRHRLFRDQPLGTLVVVVGNLTVGGTGKTPVVEKFARALTERGRKVAILSRGYKSRQEPAWRRWLRAFTGEAAPPPKVVSDGERVLLDSLEAGDEPFMLARNLPGVVVLVDKNRVKAGAHAIRRFGCDTLLLDDGFQYLALRGALNLLLIDKQNPFGNEQLLPRGLLREGLHHMQRASYVLLTKSDGRPDPELLDTIQSHRPGVDISECAHRPKFVADLAQTVRHELAWLRGRRIAAFSGIAVPESFESLLAELGAELACRRRYLDHHRFDAADLEEIYDGAAAAGVDAVVTTEKDAVRLPAGFRPRVPTYFLRLEVELLKGDTGFQEAVERICFGRRPAGAGGA